MARDQVVFRVDLSGEKEVRKALDLLGKHAGRSLAGAVRKAVRPVVKEAKRNAVFAEGTDTLQRSLKAKVRVDRRRGYVVGIVGADKNVVGTDEYGNRRRPVRYLHLVEFGTKDRYWQGPSGKFSGSVKPTPIIRPAYRVMRSQSLGIFRRAIWAEVSREAKKLGRVRRFRVSQLGRKAA